MSRRRTTINDTGVAPGDTKAYTGHCVSRGKEHHDKCPGVQKFSWGMNDCPCSCHVKKTKRKKKES